MAVAHGKMNEKQLEKIMLDFIANKYDVLLSTNIIESGLDIPTAEKLGWAVIAGSVVLTVLTFFVI